MNHSVQEKIINLYLSRRSQSDIVVGLKTGYHRVIRCIQNFKEPGKIPKTLHRGRLVKFSNDILDFLEVRTLQNALLSARVLQQEISKNYERSLSNTTKTGISLQLPSHNQKLAEIQIMNRLNFCKKGSIFPIHYQRFAFRMNPDLFLSMIRSGYSIGKVKIIHLHQFPPINFHRE
jgi:hypothetical protein